MQSQYGSSQCYSCGRCVAATNAVMHWRRTLAAPWMLLVPVMLFAGPAHAAYWCNTRNPTDIDLPFATTISVAPSVKNGSAITAWTAIDSIEKAFVCATRARDRIGVYNVGTALVASSYTYGTNPQYTVWKTNLPGVGIAVRTWTYLSWSAGVRGNCTDGWRGPANLTTTAIVTGSSSGTASGAAVSCGGSLIQSASWGGKSEAILIKIGDVSPGKFKRTQVFAMRIGGTGDSWYGGGSYDRKYFLGTTSFSRPTCSTPDLTVAMGTHFGGEFAKVGTALAPVKFTVQFNNCPAGYSKITYHFSSLQSLNNDQGLLKLTTDSTAKGVGLKVMQSDGKPLKLGVWNTLGSYQSSKGGNYTLDLQAALYRTGEVSAGSFKSEMELTMGYE